MKLPKYKEPTIQYRLAMELLRRGHTPVVPNVQLDWGECDLVSLTAAGYVNDWEIKCSRADFKADFKKSKHRTIKYLLEARDSGKLDRYPPQRTPNYLWYAVPVGLISPDEVPEYAGVIQVAVNNGFASVKLRQAPLLHNFKANMQLIRLLAHVSTFKIWNLRSECARLAARGTQKGEHCQKCKRGD